MLKRGSAQVAGQDLLTEHLIVPRDAPPFFGAYNKQPSLLVGGVASLGLQFKLQSNGVQALIEKIKRQLGPIMFTEFRQEAGKFMSGAIDAETYHREVASLGLASLIPEMASLLPEPLKRAELLSVHETVPALSSGRSVSAALHEVRKMNGEASGLLLWRPRFIVQGRVMLERES